MKNLIYQPPKKILEKYAKVLVNFALNSGKGVKKNEVVECLVPDVAKALALELQNAILKSGAHPLIKIIPTGFEKDFFGLAKANQLTFFPENYQRSRVNLIDHTISILADVDPSELSKTDPKKILLARDSKKRIRDWLNAKELKGQFTWTIALWGVEAKAQIVGLTLEKYWDQIIKACFLDKKDPISEWRKVASAQEKILKKLNHLEIDQVRVTGKDVDLIVKIGKDRKWLGGSGRNIPSFECFTSPDWRGTTGHIKFNQPLYRYGQIISDIEMEFDKGLVVKARAKKGQKFLEQMLKSNHADKLGEFSLTDSRMSRITHPMAETLFDENIGGKFGNMHVAIGMAYRDAYRSDPALLSETDWFDLGYNDSPEHTDMVSTSDRQVVARLNSGTEKLIYKSGKFIL